MLKHLHPLDITQLALEICGGTDFVAHRCPELRQLQPEPGVFSGKRGPVMPANIATNGEGPFREAWIGRPACSEVWTYRVHVFAAAHHQITRPKQCSSDVVQSNTACPQGVEAGRRITSIGQHENAAVSFSTLIRRGSGRGIHRCGRRLCIGGRCRLRARSGLLISSRWRLGLSGTRKRQSYNYDENEKYRRPQRYALQDLS